MLAIESPYPQFFDLDGRPLDAGYIYIGLENQYPETAPVPVYWDPELTQPAPQPIRTKNGYAARNGTPAFVYAADNHSMMVRNSRRTQVVYAKSSKQFNVAALLRYEYSLPSGAGLIGFDDEEDYPEGSAGAAIVNSVLRMQNYTALRAYTGRSMQVRITQPGLAGMFFRDTGDTETADNGGTVIVDVEGRRWKRDAVLSLDVRWFGASTALADNSAAFRLAIQALSARGGEIVVPSGQFNFTDTIDLGSGDGAVVKSLRNGIRIMGAGAGFAVSGALVPTILNYSGPSVSKSLISILGQISDIRLDGLFLNCNGLCSGISMISVSGSTFSNLKIVNPKETGMAVIGGGAPVGNYNIHNKFSNISMGLITPGSTGLYMDGDWSVQNDTWISHFELMRIETVAGATGANCAWFRFVDSCTFTRCHFVNTAEPTSKGVILDATSNNDFPSGLAFYDCSVHKWDVLETDTAKILKNYCYGLGEYDLEVMPTHPMICGITAKGTVLGNWMYGEPWLDYTSAVTATVGTITSASGAVHWRKLGRFVYVNVSVFITTNGSGATSVVCTLPPNAGLANSKNWFLTGRNRTTGTQIIGEVPSGSSNVIITRYDGAYPGANSTELQLSGYYEVSA